MHPSKMKTTRPDHRPPPPPLSPPRPSPRPKRITAGKGGVVARNERDGDRIAEVYPRTSPSKRRLEEEDNNEEDKDRPPLQKKLQYKAPRAIVQSPLQRARSPVRDIPEAFRRKSSPPRQSMDIDDNGFAEDVPAPDSNILGEVNPDMGFRQNDPCDDEGPENWENWDPDEILAYGQYDPREYEIVGPDPDYAVDGAGGLDDGVVREPEVKDAEPDNGDFYDDAEEPYHGDFGDEGFGDGEIEGEPDYEGVYGEQMEGGVFEDENTRVPYADDDVYEPRNNLGYPEEDELTEQGKCIYQVDNDRIATMGSNVYDPRSNLGYLEEDELTEQGKCIYQVDNDRIATMGSNVYDPHSNLGYPEEDELTEQGKCIYQVDNDRIATMGRQPPRALCQDAVPPREGKFLARSQHISYLDLFPVPQTAVWHQVPSQNVPRAQKTNAPRWEEVLKGRQGPATTAYSSRHVAGNTKGSLDPRRPHHVSTRREGDAGPTPTHRPTGNRGKFILYLHLLFCSDSSLLDHFGFNPQFGSDERDVLEEHRTRNRVVHPPQPQCLVTYRDLQHGGGNFEYTMDDPAATHSDDESTTTQRRRRAKAPTPENERERPYISPNGSKIAIYHSISSPRKNSIYAIALKWSGKAFCNVSRGSCRVTDWIGVTDYHHYNASLQTMIWKYCLSARSELKKIARTVVQVHFRQAFDPDDIFRGNAGFNQEEYFKVVGERTRKLLDESAFHRARLIEKTVLLYPIYDFIRLWIYTGDAKKPDNCLFVHFPQESFHTQLVILHIAAAVVYLLNGIEECETGIRRSIELSGHNYAAYYMAARQMVEGALLDPQTGHLLAEVYTNWHAEILATRARSDGPANVNLAFARQR
ncbi:hypothetical protein FB451DRAFT_1404441 [Mycena latifolia]|nr:hypothetical protein FB451DRAFT_1404441 [Mycena latifolia]